MSKREDTLVEVESNIIIMDNIEYIMGNIGDFNISPRLEDVFTASELRCGRTVENSFDLVDLPHNANVSNVMDIMELSKSTEMDTESDVPTFEINDSDEDVIFVAEYNNNTIQNELEGTSSYVVPYPVSGSEDSSSGSSSREIVDQNEPRRNPTRNARNKKYKKKCSEYITDEDLNVLMASDEDSGSIGMVEDSESIKETRKKKNFVKNWPADGLHERPEYNEETGKLEKFDCTIRQIERSTKKMTVKKTKVLKTPKKKYYQKKFNFKRGNKKNVFKKKQIELVSFGTLANLINDNYTSMSEVFMKIVSDSRYKKLHICCISTENEESQSVIDENINQTHKKCVSVYTELLMNQCFLYCIGNEGADPISFFNKMNQKEYFSNEKYYLKYSVL